MNDDLQHCVSFQYQKPDPEIQSLIKLPEQDHEDGAVLQPQKEITGLDSFNDEFSSIADGKESMKSQSTAQFQSIERMRDSLDKYERDHKLKQTMQGFHEIRKSLQLTDS